MKTRRKYDNGRESAAMVGWSKREFMAGSLAAAAIAREASASIPSIAPGRFTPTVASLLGYQAPDCFRDGRSGIWAHRGPQAVPRQGDWYARFMYCPGHPHYAHHVKTYGHPPDFGYKDIIPLWTAERFDPEALMPRHAAAGARYFVSMGVHHDNFDRRVRLLGHPTTVTFRQTDRALVIDCPERLPTRHASAFEVSFA